MSSWVWVIICILVGGVGCHIILTKSDRTIIYEPDESSYKPTPIPLTSVVQVDFRAMKIKQFLLNIYFKESPTFSTTTTPENLTVTTFTPQNHQQIPFLPRQLEGLQSQSSITESIFIPGNVEHGFHPISQMSNVDRFDDIREDVTNSRFDKGPAYFIDLPRKYNDHHTRHPTRPPYEHYNPYRTIPIPLKQPSFTSRPIRGYPYPRNKPHDSR